MPIRIALETERGERIEWVTDAHLYLQRLLPPPSDESYQCLRFIDWYGNTVFNHLQVDRLLRELERIKPAAQTDDERKLLGEIARLAVRCRDEVHEYLKFYGD